jgi:hypothetical protein
MASDPKGLLDNPNAVTQENPMLQTTATQPSNVTMTGAAAQANKPPPVVPTTPGDRQLLSPLPGQSNGQTLGADFAKQVSDYENALGYDPETMSVEGRVARMVDDPNNPLLQQARNRSSQEMAGRGLRNSSIGLQASEEAAYAAALPIAQTDAQIAMQNRLAAFGAAVEDQQLMKQHGYDLEKIDKEYQNNRGLADQQFSFNKELQSREFTHAETLQERGFKHDSNMQANEFKHNIERMAQQFGYDKHLQSVDLASREKIAAMERQVRERIADKEIAARTIEAEKQRIWASAERQAQNIFAAEQQFAQNEFAAGQASLEMAWKSAESQQERDSLWERSVYELDRNAEQYGLDRESRERIAAMQQSGSNQISAIGSITDIIAAGRAAEGSAAASGAKNAGTYIDQIRRNTQHDINTALKLWENAGVDNPGQYVPTGY